jgi:uncharacterized cupredoxin-like copper-binding protein
MKLRALATLLLVAVAPIGCGGGASERAIGVRMRYSRYLPAAITVKAGTTVDFTLKNADPIDHEFIIGTTTQQLAHERGDPHDPHTGPGEAEVAANTTKDLRFAFATPGTFQYACHRPGHYAYGMVGTITVTA